MRARQTQWGPIVGLFLVAPFVGEFLLGNLTVAELPIGLLLAPMYGFGALLVRELGRRTGGWPTMVLLAAAYALFEEGPVDQLLWNDSYAGQDLLHGPTYLPSLGMSVALVQQVLSLHTIWSICVPIALVEALAGARRNTVWMGRFGLVVTGALFTLGAVLVFFGNYSEEHFVASPWQLGAVGVVIGGLVLLALLVVPRRRLARTPGDPPDARWVGGAALAGSSVILVSSDWCGWVGVVVWCLTVTVSVWSVQRWARRTGWTPQHTCALAAGAAVTYIWLAFPMRPEGGGSMLVDLLSNAVFGLLGCLLVGWATIRARREGTPVVSSVARPVA
ncbi:DUF998 domain-containing protein [Nocardia brasiliensis]|uniref:DUF998 domain-containing protein n=1 Tax=Nocardia brasiliensis TaxID=37326 RepID=A0A6G9XRD4_NOCBR|nr:DUF998 domain-containing protein [Nocardia brasiliensis]QIS03511.1 DUF998 domain-containing protein [Nocardia brasiliensis]